MASGTRVGQRPGTSSSERRRQETQAAVGDEDFGETDADTTGVTDAASFALDRSFASTTSRGGRKKVRHVPSRYMQAKTPTKLAPPTPLPHAAPKTQKTPTKPPPMSPSSRTPGRSGNLVAARIAAGMVPGVAPPTVARKQPPPPSTRPAESRARATVANADRTVTKPKASTDPSKLPEDALLLRRSRLLQWKYLNARAAHAAHLRQLSARQQLEEAFEVAKDAQERAGKLKVEVDREEKAGRDADALEEQGRALSSLAPHLDPVRPAYAELARALRASAIRMPLEGVVVTDRDALVTELEKCSHLLEALKHVAIDAPDGSSAAVRAVLPTRSLVSSLTQTLTLLTASADLVRDLERALSVSASLKLGTAQVSEVGVDQIGTAVGGLVGSNS
ncbi:hypothetical protein M427DRAFT_65986 [Gonapodya prolifera JEL478]|uniref:Uncharacterized protein n=1 Tax=Gonapodya prolifera (strain JEL478) TaxID=1344416 RepID=A0A139AWU9_GONPJ|nr:hypothetical protein M427DRAFT_65986 [Gonapodya prolifera JEL478]|eukprot:KXS21222.1 hypothetical protein M427DRAFT_65986 [Gonapodya prolifera JEL478]